MNFGQAAAKSPDQLAGDFSAPLGVMLAAQGVLTKEQTDASGEVQAQMIAVRDAVETGAITQDHAKAALGEFKGALDFGKLAKTDDAGRTAILAQAGITQTQLISARDVVTNAQATRANVNQGRNIAVPPIGFIHTDLHAKNIPNFGQIKQGALLAQRAIDAADALDRIESRNFDAQKGAARGFKLWGDESAELADIVTLCEALNDFEENGTAFIPPAFAIRVNGAFEDARETFLNAGYPALAQAIENVRAHKLGVSAVTIKATDVANDSNDPPAP